LDFESADERSKKGVPFEERRRKGKLVIERGNKKCWMRLEAD